MASHKLWKAYSHAFVSGQEVMCDSLGFAVVVDELSFRKTVPYYRVHKVGEPNIIYEVSQRALRNFNILDEMIRQ